MARERKRRARKRTLLGLIPTGGCARDTGLLGNPSSATADAGQAVVEGLVQELASWIAREFEMPC